MELGEINVYFIQANERADCGDYWWTMRHCYSSLEAAQTHIIEYLSRFPHVETRIVKQTTINKII